MNAWWRITIGPDGAPALPAEAEPDEVYFVEGTTEAATWGRGYSAPCADETAAHAWAATAHAAAQAAYEAGATAAVVGEGALAALIRRALPLRSALPDAPPDVVLETTGTGAGITRALRTVRTGGHVILAVRPLEPTTPVATCHDVHRREIRVTSVPWRGGHPRTAPAHLVSWALAHLVSAPPGQPTPPGLWHRLAGGPVPPHVRLSEHLDRRSREGPDRLLLPAPVRRRAARRGSCRPG
ncbi:hypothetical protein A6A06_25660 [Streptomyces sp. CB02923]|nr:hypothetical protein A6A06_25660 [Streptomyces sp. CB02923]